MSVPLWTRRHPPRPDREAEVVLYVFSRGDPERGPLASGPFGLPEGGLHGVEVRRHPRAAASEWFDTFRSGSLRASAAAHLDDLTALDAADTCHSIRVTVPDPPDLGHLQAAWAVARWLLASGADVVLDGAPIRFRSAAPPPRPHLDIRDHVSILVETTPSLGDDGFAMHTRGLRAFGRPDLVTVVRPTDVDPLGPVLLRLAAALADGWMPETATEVDLGEGAILAVHHDPGLALVRALGLNNDALVLTDPAGDALVGFAERLGATGRA